jgi:hypothetical protein
MFARPGNPSILLLKCDQWTRLNYCVQRDTHILCLYQPPFREQYLTSGHTQGKHWYMHIVVATTKIHTHWKLTLHILIPSTCKMRDLAPASRSGNFEVQKSQDFLHLNSLSPFNTKSSIATFCITLVKSDLVWSIGSTLHSEINERLLVHLLHKTQAVLSHCKKINHHSLKNRTKMGSLKFITVDWICWFCLLRLSCWHVMDPEPHVGVHCAC